MRFTSGTFLVSRGKYWPTVYGDQLLAVHDSGIRREARGTVSYELRPTMAVIEDTSARFIVVPGRGLNHCFALAEAVSIIAAHNSVDFLRFYNSQMLNFTSDGVRFDGHYGERLACSKQIDYVIDELKRDPGSRRAMVTIWSPETDTRPGSLDYPCNVLAMFKVYDGKLDCHVVRRSSDLIWGVPYDHVVFTTIQDVIAASLKMKSGRMVETTDSLHLYRDTYDDTLERAIMATSAGKVWAIMNGRQECDLTTTRMICDLIIKSDARLREVPPTMFQLARDVQRRIPDGWWSDAWMTMATYHLWKQGQYSSFLRALSFVSVSFRSALWSTFEARVESKREKLGAGFTDEFASITRADAVDVCWQERSES